MKPVTHSMRIEPGKLDDKTIKTITSDIARRLAEAAGGGEDVAAKLHLKIGHIRAGFSRSGHVKIIIGNPDGPGDEPEEPEAPSGGN